MKQKNCLLGILGLMILLLSIVNVSATSTFVTPGASAKISGSAYEVNITSDMAHLINCTVTANSTLSGDNLATMWLYNYTGTGNDEVNASFDTFTLEDATDYTWAGTCYNSSATESVTSRTGITVDNTVPTTPTTILPATSTTKNNIPISTVVTGANTTACTLTLSSSFTSESYAMTHSGNTCTKTVSVSGGGDFTISITATDGTNTSSAGTSQIKIEEQTGGGTLADTSTTTTTGKSSTTTIIIIALLLLGGYVYMQNKGGTKTRSRKTRR